MIRIFRILLTYGLGVGLGASLSACSHAPRSYIPEGKTCDLRLGEIEVILPENPRLRASMFEDAVDRAFGDPEAPLLFLSGGSQNGAFGAGYLDEWSKLRGGLPPFRLVTGVSTGALQSTGAFIGDIDMVVKTAELESESVILETYVSGQEVRDSLGLPAILSLVRRGVVSDLIPLRNELERFITDDVLILVAQGDAEGRKLFVGVTDFDTGRAVAIDMTDLATRFAANPIDNAHLKTCYHEVLVASSVVPVAARPVFIDNRMYIDGGVRFAVLSDDIRQKVERAAALPTVSEGVAAPPPPTLIHMVLNGDGEPSIRCGKANDADCANADNRVGTHEKWDFADLAIRSISLLKNQIARLSVDRAVTLRGRTAEVVAFARIIESDMETHPYHVSNLPAVLRPDGVDGTLGCAAWETIDIELDDPVEFHPRYMHCLVDYGRTVARDRFEAEQ